ncbi:hypothetical protein B296_00021515 [Ensete ventricosum]|uniref:Uncharacterized protein n=1 Tax=Ensete ventricosum TaxID=4639 RepID=A0A426Y2A0_ENSVE|nr:hypothetical protein B296_00021515 [Ensete ventricosum]
MVGFTTRSALPSSMRPIQYPKYSRPLSLSCSLRACCDCDLVLACCGQEKRHGRRETERPFALWEVGKGKDAFGKPPLKKSAVVDLVRVEGGTREGGRWGDRTLFSAVDACSRVQGRRMQL